MRGRAMIIVVLALAAAEPAGARTLHVRAGGSLAAAEARSRPGDRIVVHAAAAAYEGGIRLKPRQRLIGRGSPRIAGGPSGDAVRLARRTTVRGLHIVRAARGAIYGRNAGRVVIRGNDVTGHNTSCTRGLPDPALQRADDRGRRGRPDQRRAHNGWAAIMVDATRGARPSSSAATASTTPTAATASTSAPSDSADVTRAHHRQRRLRACARATAFSPSWRSGCRPATRARMTATVDRNRQSALGNDEADSEGVFVNPTGASSLTATVTRNTYTHVAGRGGFSANGLEFVSMGDGAHGDLTVRDSRFSGTPGDVLEQLALGTNADAADCAWTTSCADDGRRRASATPSSSPATTATACVSASGGAGNTVALTVRDSQLTDCANNGLTFGSAVANGTGPTRSLVARRRRQPHHRQHRQQPARRQRVRAGLPQRARGADTDLADARGLRVADARPTRASRTSAAPRTRPSPSPAAASTAARSARAAVGFDVDARGNWWGGPPRAAGDVRTDPVLAPPEAPTRCG